MTNRVNRMISVIRQFELDKGLKHGIIEKDDFCYKYTIDNVIVEFSNIGDLFYKLLKGITVWV
jgi:hypothetical protein